MHLNWTGQGRIYRLILEENRRIYSDKQYIRQAGEKAARVRTLKERRAEGGVESQR